MDNLKKIIKENIDLDDFENYEDITKIIEDNLNLKEELKENITEIKINNNNYYIINITCDYCGNNYYYLSDYDNINYIKDYENFNNSNNYNVICEHCFDEHFYSCDYCGEVLEEDEGVWCDDSYMMYCDDCAEQYLTKCDECGEWHTTENCYRLANDDCICEHCYNNGDYYYCEGCGELFYIDDLIYNESDGYEYCNSCYEDNCCEFDYYNAKHRNDKEIIKHFNEYDSINAISSYHTNPIDFELRKAEKDKENEKLYFGVELEISTEYRENINQASHFVADNFYCRLEEDSSIPNYGFEIISDPMTFNKWHERKIKIDQVFNELTNNGFVSHNARGGNCGLHIHASREALGNTEAEQENTINNIILITENFKKELQQFSRRSNFSWCHFFNDDTENNAELNIEKIKEEKGKKGRYQVININNYKTIEFRLCRGTLKTNTFFASIQLFYNIIQLAKNNNFINATWQDLININNFKELQKYNEERQIKSNTTIKIINKKPEPKKEIFETVIILKNNKDTQKEINYILNQLEDKNIIKLEKQGIKNLAYPINEEKQGYYIIIEHHATYEEIEDFEKYLNLNDNVLKYLTYKKEA